MIESFLASRGNLVGALLVIDSRREWTQDEVLLVRFLQKIRKPVAVVLTKSDKLNRSEENSVRQKYKVLPGVEAIYFVSSLKRTGLKELEEGVFRAWIATSAGAST